jgi:dTDP-4-amino-4,6-dideoxygalactose transaminase
MAVRMPNDTHENRMSESPDALQQESSPSVNAPNRNALVTKAAWDAALYVSVFLVGAFGFCLAYLIRFDFAPWEPWSSQCSYLLPYVAVIKLCCYYIIARSVSFSRYWGFRESLLLTIFAAVSSLLMLSWSLMLTPLHVPRGVIAIDFLITLLFVGAVSVIVRNLRGYYRSAALRSDGSRRSVVIIGFDDTCETFVAESIRDPHAGVEVKAIFDDDAAQNESQYHGVPIRSLGSLKSYTNERHVDSIFVTIPPAGQGKRTRINRLLAEINIPVRVLFPFLEAVDRLPAVTSLEDSVVIPVPDLLNKQDPRLAPPAGSYVPIPLVRPSLPEIGDVFNLVKASYQSGMVTGGRLVGLLEEEMRAFTNVSHAIAVSSGTSGLMIAFASLELPTGAEVIVPSFTFAATIQALLWNHITPVYVDCLPDTMTLDPDEVEKAVGPDTIAVCPVAVFGLPPDLARLEEISKAHDIPLICDSAQGLGSTYMGKPAGGFGMCEIFSLSPGKVITAVEGGIITTNDSEAAIKLRAMRDYGKGPDGLEMVFRGLSARMVESNAAVGLLNLRMAESLITARLRLIDRYRERLNGLPGCSTQSCPSDRDPSGSHFVIRIGEGAKIDRDGLIDKLKEKNIHSKKYFYPPAHAQKVFRDAPHRIVGDLRHTWTSSETTLALPLYSHMTDEDQDRVCEVIESALT